MNTIKDAIKSGRTVATVTPDIEVSIPAAVRIQKLRLGDQVAAAVDRDDARQQAAPLMRVAANLLSFQSAFTCRANLRHATKGPQDRD